MEKKEESILEIFNPSLDSKVYPLNKGFLHFHAAPSSRRRDLSITWLQSWFTVAHDEPSEKNHQAPKVGSDEDLQVFPPPP